MPKKNKFLKMYPKVYKIKKIKVFKIIQNNLILSEQKYNQDLKN